VVWFCGVRRVGKSAIVASLDNSLAHLVDCENLPNSVTPDTADFLYRASPKPILILDEAQALSGLPAILARCFESRPKLGIVVVSSTGPPPELLNAVQPVKTVAIHCVPFLWNELINDVRTQSEARLYYGGFPVPLIREDTYSPATYDDWMAVFFACDFSGHSKTEDFQLFRKVFRGVLRRSGEPLNLTTLAAEAGSSRKTVSNIVHCLEDLCAVSLLNPHHQEPKRPGREVTSTPLLYACDTGLVCRIIGWNENDGDLKNRLWRHVVLEYLQA